MKINKLNSYFLSMFFVSISGFAIASATEFIDNSAKPILAKDDFFGHANAKWLNNRNTDERLCSVQKEIQQNIDEDVTRCLKTKYIGKNNFVNIMYQSILNKDSNNKISKDAIKKQFDGIDNRTDTIISISQLLADLNLNGVAAFLSTTVKSDPSTGKKTAFITPGSKIPADEVTSSYVMELFKNSGVATIDEATAKQVADIEQDVELLEQGSGVFAVNSYSAYKEFQFNSLPADMKPLYSYLVFSNLTEKASSAKFAEDYIRLLYISILEPAITTPKKLAALRAYLKFRFLYTYKDFLPNASKSTIETKYSEEEKSLIALQYTKRIFASELSRLCFKDYVESHKSEFNDLKLRILNAYEQSIQNTPWMTTDKTKLRAIAKLKKISWFIGHPPEIENFSSDLLQFFKPNNLISNLMLLNSIYYRNLVIEQLSDISNELGAWRGTSYKTVSPYYLPVYNAIVIPVLALRPPYFQPGDDPINYGALGAVIGHELSHAFDIEGRQYNENGIPESWMTPEERSSFDGIARRLATLYPKASTVNEDLADTIGLTIARAAYDNLVIAKPKIQAPISDDKLFYYSFAEIWREKAPCIRPSDIYSPGYYRVQNVFKYSPKFQELFEIKKGDGMYSDQQMKIW